MKTSGWRIEDGGWPTHSVLPESTPMGLHHSAQGCEDRATLGGLPKWFSTLKELQQIASFGRAFRRWLQPRWGCARLGVLTQGSSFVAILGWRLESLWDLAKRGVNAALLAGLVFVSTVHAQQFSIDWSTIDGGGGTSTGGVYSVRGTIGQPDVGVPMTNGQYSVTGGFWALPTAIQVVGAPTLTIVPVPQAHATISWSPKTPGFVLQERLSLSPTNWVNSASGSTNPIVVPATLPTKFYRLFKP